MKIARTLLLFLVSCCCSGLVFSQNETLGKQASRLLILGKDLQKRGKLDSANHYYLKVITLAEENGLTNSLAYREAALIMGNSMVANFRMDEAEAYLKKAVAARAPGDESISQLHCDALQSMGDLYAAKGEYEPATQYYRHLLQLLKVHWGESHISYAGAWQGLAQIQLESGAFQEAEQALRKALQIYTKNSTIPRSDLASLWNDFGLLYSAQGEFDLAERYYNQALKAYEQQVGADPLDRAMVLGNLGDLQEEMGNYLGAKPYYRELFAIREKNLSKNHPDYARALILIGNLAWYDKKRDSAIYYYEQAQAIFKNTIGELHPDYGVVLINLGQLHAEKKDYFIAESYYQQCLAIRLKSYGATHPAYLACLVRLANLYKTMGEDRQAIAYFTQAHAQKIKAVTDRFSWLSSMGRAAFWEQELSFYQTLNTYAAKVGKAYPELLDLVYQATAMAKSILMQSDRELEALVTTSKDIILLKNYTKIKTLRKQEIKLFLEQAEEDGKIESIRLAADSLDKNMVQRLQALGLGNHETPVDWQEIQDHLGEQEAAIEFIRYLDEGEKAYKYMALLVHSGLQHPEMIKLGREDKIRQAIKNRDFSSLYPLVWQGIDSLMTGIKTIYYSPDGELNLLALHAICADSSGSGKTSESNINRGITPEKDSVQVWSCKNYLLDKYELHQVTSTRYLAEKSFGNSTPLTKTIRLIGGVDYDLLPKRWTSTISGTQRRATPSTTEKQKPYINRTYSKDKMPALPGTKKEVETIQNILHQAQWKSVAMMGGAAEEGAFNRAVITDHTTILHIATHGFSFPARQRNEGSGPSTLYRQLADPMLRSGLMLSGSNISWTGGGQRMLKNTGEDGILTAAEVSTLNLSKTQLIVLSACETGMGKIDGWEGTYGLKRGFKLAGVDKLIVSLWPVPDQETAELMTLFYKELVRSNNIVDSFNKAQREMRNKYGNQPELWAGFVLVR